MSAVPMSPGGPASPAEIEAYEKLIRRMKVLSKSQTSLLKVRIALIVFV